MLSQEVAGDGDAGLAPGRVLRVCRRKENPAGIPATHPQERNGFLSLVVPPLPHHMSWVCRPGYWSRRKPNIHPRSDVHVLQGRDSQVSIS